jgi:glycosyltransferase involved in cell wall biosynthesis
MASKRLAKRVCLPYYSKENVRLAVRVYGGICEMNKIIYITYDLNLPGGIEKINRIFMNRFNDMIFHYSISDQKNYFYYISYSLLAYFKYIYKLIRQRPSVAHIIIASRMDFLRNMLYIILSRLAVRRVLVQFRTSLDWSFFSFPSPLRYLIKRILRRSHIILFLGRSLRKEFSDNVFEMPSLVLGNPLADDFFEKAPLPFEDRRHQVLYLGRYHHSKGIFDLAQAARLHTEADQEIIYECHGTGRKPEGLSDRFRCLGWVGGQEKLNLLRCSKVLVLPSYFEGFPNSLLEAMACGTPVVASDVGATPDLVKNGENGMLIRAGDVNGLYESLERMVNDREFWSRCSKKARDTAENYRLEKILKRWEILYDTLSSSDKKGYQLADEIASLWERQEGISVAG